MPHAQIYEHTASQFRGPQAWESNTTGEGGIVQVYTESMMLKGGKLGGGGGGGEGRKIHSAPSSVTKP